MSTQNQAVETPALVTDAQRLDQLKLIYDYVKFHIGLYLSTPAVLLIAANSASKAPSAILSSTPFRIGFGVMILAYLCAGAHAGLFIGRNINVKWTPGFLTRFERAAFLPSRTIFHHSFYWVGLIAALIGLAVAICLEQRT